MRTLLIVAALCLTTRPGVAAEDAYDGNKLLSLCQTDPVSCSWYIMGTAHGFGLASSIAGPSPTVSLCVPPNSTMGQLKDIVVKGLVEDPGRRHWWAPALIFNSINDAFPCHEKADD